MLQKQLTNLLFVGTVYHADFSYFLNKSRLHACRRCCLHNQTCRLLFAWTSCHREVYAWRKLYFRRIPPLDTVRFPGKISLIQRSSLINCPRRCIKSGVRPKNILVWPRRFFKNGLAARALSMVSFPWQAEFQLEFHLTILIYSLECHKTCLINNNFITFF